MMNRATSRWHQQALRQISTARTPLLLEFLEDRTLLTVDVGAVFDGISYTGYYPPDTIAAAGYDYVIEAVNLTIQYYDKGGTLLFSTPLNSFFDPLGDVLSASDPVVTFDVLTGQFLVGMADSSLLNKLSRFDLAVSNDANPFDGWQFQR